MHNFKVLVGLPQTYLNIVQRWDDGLITDVLAFLRQNWTMAVYYDKAQDFIVNLRAKFRKQRDIQMLSEYILEHVQVAMVGVAMVAMVVVVVICGCGPLLGRLGFQLGAGGGGFGKRAQLTRYCELWRRRPRKFF